jgi:hypothetical protein
MKGNHDRLATPQRSLRTHPLPTLYGSTEWHEGDKPFELVTVCLWSVVGVALTTLLIWLALGGEVQNGLAVHPIKPSSSQIMTTPANDE